ncbi:hypothetical protein C7972_115116 [Arenibacter sp. ARW7G5Y1]|nr:hypothetical protein C7972_115116 [Arenibacter sp. ARW7G5Y1]|tara:strand:+ start:104 stop:370 length:267 start_codon:yes stop_codon:yes gene_type:complete
MHLAVLLIFPFYFNENKIKEDKEAGPDMDLPHKSQLKSPFYEKPPTFIFYLPIVLRLELARNEETRLITHFFSQPINYAQLTFLQDNF